MSDNSLNAVWVFNSYGARFPGAVFISYDKALYWIAEHKFPTFIGGFTTASQPHFHFIDGLLDCD
jgi:hypothetical protein